MKRKRYTPEERRAFALEALGRATSRLASNNDGVVIAAFAERGIDATPRVDVFTYAAWQALGRQVRRGEKSVTVTTWIPLAAKEGDPKRTGGMIPRRAYVFHVSQTDPIPGAVDRSGGMAERRAELEAFAAELGTP